VVVVYERIRDLSNFGEGKHTELEKPALTTVPDSGTSKTIHVPGMPFIPGFQPRASGVAFASVLI